MASYPIRAHWFQWGVMENAAPVIEPAPEAGEPIVPAPAPAPDAADEPNAATEATVTVRKRKSKAN